MGAYGRFDLVYIKTDKNGTKYYNDINCPRCSGYGGASKWNLTGHICYACGGTGKRPQPKTVKVYTPEYEAKLEARRAAKAPQKDAERAAKAKAMQDEMRVRTWMEQGFSADGSGFIHYGETYRNREKLKASGGRWCQMLKAYIAPTEIECEGVKTMKINAEQICHPFGYIDSDKAWELSESWR